MRAFETTRLRLRPLDAHDEALYCKLYTDPGLMRHIGTPMSPEAARRSFHVVLEHQGGSRMVWVITERGYGSERGILGVSRKEESAEVGVILFAAAQARGIAAEVIAAIADILFEARDIGWIWTRHDVKNAPADALMRNLGFEPLAPDRRPLDMPKGEMRWQLTHDMWRRRTPVLVARARSDR